MPKRRPRFPPDTRPSWRDPNMPVFRNYRMADGTTRTLVDPDYEHRYREMLMATSIQPDYHRDPTYHLRKDRPK